MHFVDKLIAIAYLADISYGQEPTCLELNEICRGGLDTCCDEDADCITDETSKYGSRCLIEETAGPGCVALGDECEQFESICCEPNHNTC